MWSRERDAAQAVCDVAAHREGRELRFDEGGRIERLLVCCSRARPGAVAPPGTRQAQHPVRETTFVTQPGEARQPRRRRLGPAERDAAEDESLREPRVVVSE